MMASEIAVTVGGQKYLVIGDGADATVRVIIDRSPVSARGSYQQDTVYRTLKRGSALHKAAVKQAAYDRATGKGA